MGTDEDYSPGDIARGFTRMEEALAALRQEVAAGFRDIKAEYVTKEKYAADEERRAEVRAAIESNVAENRLDIADLSAESARRARERRSLWTAIIVSLGSCFVTGSISILIAVTHH